MAMSEPASLPALVFARVAAHGPETILRKKDRGIWQAISWSALGGRIRAIGTALREAGIGNGTVAGILAETGPDWIAADIAIQGVGGISLGLAPTDPAEAIAAALREAGCRLVFVENEEQLDKVLPMRARCPQLACIVIMDTKGLRDFADPMCESLEAFAARGAAVDVAHPERWLQGVAAIAPQAIAVLAATAGTSEAPRLVALSHANLLTQLAQAARLTGQAATDERIAFLPLSLITERVFGLYLALSCGSVSNLVESPETVPENLQEARPSVMFAIPRIWEKLFATVTVTAGGATWLQRQVFRLAMALAERRVAVLLAGAAVPTWLDAVAGLADALVLRQVRRAIGLDRLRLAWVGGAPIAAELVRWYLALGVHLRQVYAVTEAAGLAALSPADPPRPGCVGVPLPAGELAVSPEGEVLLRGPQVCAGLWRDGGVVPATDAAGWFHTGDLGRLDGGQLVLTGRAGDAIVTDDGRTTMPAEPESRIKLSPFIADVVLVGDGRQALACLVMLEFDAVEKWAHERNIAFTSPASLARAEPVVALVAAELAARAPDLMLAGFRIVAGRIEPEDPEMTPAMRLRRHVVLRKHGDLIDDLYRAA
jgi:long-chain acyl-CoA synthetase